MCGNTFSPTDARPQVDLLLGRPACLEPRALAACAAAPVRVLMGAEMRPIEWTPEMSVGSEVLDEHHRMIVDCLNMLRPLLAGQGSPADLRAVIDRLEHFVLVHFAEEERLMIAAGHPHWKAHKALHDKMFGVVFDLKSDIELGRTVDAARLHETLAGWLIDHIMGEDRKYMADLAKPRGGGEGPWTDDHRSRH